MIDSKGRCHRAGVVRLLVFTTLLQVGSISTLTSEDRTTRYLTELSESRVIGGTVAVQKAGELVWSKGFGFASEELDVPLRDYHIFPIGSNTKFFTAVAIYQLQEKGLLNVSDAVNGYIDPADFGLDGPWCPTIHGQEQLGCQEPTIRQLLQMSSGLLPTDDQSCGTPNTSWTPFNWFWPYRIEKLELTFGALSGDSGNWLNGKASAADLLRFENSMHLPMLHAPGAQYCYVNTNFNIAGYVVEKLTNMSFTSYLEELILKPANLSNTYYWLGGQGMEPQGIRKNVVSIPGYTSTFTNQSGPGAPAFQVVNRVEWLPTDLSTVAGAAGAMFSNVFDLLKWYNTFNARPEVIGLSKESLALLTEPLQPLRANVSFAQGIGVEPLPTMGKMLDYTGGIWGYLTHIQYWVNPSDPSKSDAVLFFSNLSPIIPSDPNGNCSVRSAQNGAPISLEPSACNPNGADMTTYVVDWIAQMWNITGSYSSS